MPYHYVLVDACVPAAHFAAKTTRSANLRTRSSVLFSAPQTDIKLLIPNFCIAEVFSVFEKYRWGHTWNPQVKKSSCLTNLEFESARAAFRNSIHNGSTLLQVELNRYHVLCVDLIAPINNAYKIKRNPKTKKGVQGAKKDVKPASTYDMLVVAMGIWLKHQFGEDAFTVVTGDDRLATVAERAKAESLGQPMKAHLSAVANELGLTYSKSLYPAVINLISASKSELTARFPALAANW
jgi:hypothetical protein